MSLLTLYELETMSPMFRGKCGNAICKFLMHVLSVDMVNDLYDRNKSCKGADFARSILKDIGLEYEVKNKEVLQTIPEGPFITISNHPYGHIDGLMLVDLFAHIRPDFKVLVNKVLGRIEPLSENFISVTPIGAERSIPTNDSVQGVRDSISHVRNGGSLGLFPSGAVSDLTLKNMSVRDREWQEPVIRLIKKLNVPVVPVHFLDRNSNFYYLLGLIDWRIRLLRLPAEVFNKRGRTVRIALGQVISPKQLQDIEDINKLRDFLNNRTYNLY